jgi:hypothetical protein
MRIIFQSSNQENRITAEFTIDKAEKKIYAKYIQDPGGKWIW